MSVELVVTDIIYFVVFVIALTFMMMILLFQRSWKRNKAKLEQIEKSWRLEQEKYSTATITNEQAQKLA